MSDDRYEALSALADGELGEGRASRLVDRISDDPALATRWSRYHLIGDAMRGHIAGDPGDLPGTVRERIASEPRVLRPRTGVSRLRPLVGLAIAASVAVVAILVARVDSIGEPDPGTTEVAAAGATTTGSGRDAGGGSRQSRPTGSRPTATAGVNDSAPPVTSGLRVVGTARSSLGGLRAGDVGPFHWNELNAPVAARMNGYLVNHVENRSGFGAGMHPFARIVGDERANVRR